MKNVRIVILFYLFAFVSTISAQGIAQLKLCSYFTDNMVLQRGQKIKVSGTATAHRPIVISIDGKKVKTKSDSNHQWQVYLPSLKTGGPYRMTVTDGSESITLDNILVGDVWFCSGQSNMEFMLKQTPISSQELLSIDDSHLRLYNMKALYRTNAVEWNSSILDSIQKGRYFDNPMWCEANTKTSSDFSAIAYYFGKMLRDSLNIPIGLVCNAIGGSPTEAWIDKTILEETYPEILDDWEHNDLVQDWARKRGTQNIKQATNSKQMHPYMPGYLYEIGVKPFREYPIKGVIWYQGESNAHNIECHERLFKTLIANWRQNWKNNTLPFYYVQLSSINRETWPEFRNSQRRMLYEIPYSGMAVSSDQGDSLDVHPVNKRPVGERLGKLALNHCYQKRIIPSGPLYRKMDVKQDTAYIYFDYAKHLISSDGKSIRGFELSADNVLFYPATVVDGGSCIKLFNANVLSPKYVRYGWQPYTTANLINEEGLPASTFRADGDSYHIDYNKPSCRGISTTD